MRKFVLTTALCASLTAVAPMQGHAGNSTATSSGGSGGDAAVVVLVVALGALLFGLGRSNARSTKAKKSPDSQF
ncbi:MAG: hypothetical protein AAFY49_06415 [Pseudomonadota bacterium]